jgi:hypothetical protein
MMHLPYGRRLFGARSLQNFGFSAVDQGSHEDSHTNAGVLKEAGKRVGGSQQYPPLPRRPQEKESVTQSRLANRFLRGYSIGLLYRHNLELLRCRRILQVGPRRLLTVT